MIDGDRRKSPGPPSRRASGRLKSKAHDNQNQFLLSACPSSSPSIASSIGSDKESIRCGETANQRGSQSSFVSPSSRFLRPLRTRSIASGLQESQNRGSSSLPPSIPSSRSFGSCSTSQESRDTHSGTNDRRSAAALSSSSRIVARCTNLIVSDLQGIDDDSICRHSARNDDSWKMDTKDHQCQDDGRQDDSKGGEKLMEAAPSLNVEREEQLQETKSRSLPDVKPPEFIYLYLSPPEANPKPKKTLDGTTIVKALRFGNGMSIFDDEPAPKRAVLF